MPTLGATAASRLYEGGLGVKCAVASLRVVLRAKPVLECVKNRRMPAAVTGRAAQRAERRRRLTASVAVD
jgi:hypothetical protein